MRKKKDHHQHFVRRLTRNMLIGTGIVLGSLLAGMIGYHYFESLPWLDAYLNASMVLSGMGPVNPLQTEGGKIFAASYALFSGAVFLVSIAIIFSPVFHRIIYKFHMEDIEDETKNEH